MKKSFYRLLCLVLPLILLLSAFSVPISAAGKAQDNGSEKVALLGFQRSLESDGTYAIRFVAGIASDEYTDLGMEIIVRPSIGMACKLKIKGEQLLSEIKETANGVTRTISTDELGFAALYTAVVDGVPEELEPITFKVTPYCTDGGTLVEGIEKSIIIEEDKMTVRTSYALADHKDKIKIYGRSHPATSGIACDFSASGIEFNVKAVGDIVLKVNSESTSYYTLYINGVRQENRLEFTSGTSEYKIAEGLDEGEYNIKLIKQTQIEHSQSTIMSLNICGALLPRPANKELMIEFIGDSITCGYSLFGYPTPGVDNYRGAKYMDATKSYAYLTAEKLDADFSFVCASGWAVLPNDKGGACIPAIYDKTSYKRSENEYASSRTADIVVIHLGTNDIYGRTNYATDFNAAAKQFILDVKEMNPDATIIWAYGSMSSGSNLTTFAQKITSVVNELGGADQGIYTLRVTTDTSGGHNHPSENGHAVTSNELTSFIKSLEQGE